MATKSRVAQLAAEGCSAEWKTGLLWRRLRSMPRSILSQWAQQLFSARAAPPPGPRDSMQLASNNPPDTL